jgi:hypothetical protein
MKPEDLAKNFGTLKPLVKFVATVNNKAIIAMTGENDSWG